MNSSRVTFAIIDAAAIERHFLSPFIMGFCSSVIPGRVKPSTSNISGILPRALIARFVARLVAFTIPNLSISD